MKNWLVKTYNKLFNRNAFPDAKHPIKPAFICGGVQYYTMDSVYNLPYQRGLSATMVYEELRMKCDHELLKSFTDSIDTILNGRQVKLAELMKIKHMNDIVRERLTWVIDTELLYKLASVIYFDENESPYLYDPKYCFDKIEKWKKSEDIDAFFLRQPIQSLVPFLGDVKLNFQTYSQAQKIVNEKHRTILSMKSLVRSGKHLKSKP